MARRVSKKAANARARGSMDGRDIRSRVLRGADLRGVRAEDVIAQGVDARDSNWEGAVLRRAMMRGADLRGANFRNTDLCGANLVGADLRGARWDGALLRRAKLLGAKLDSGALDHVDTFGAALPGVANVEPHWFRTSRDTHPSIAWLPAGAGARVGDEVLAVADHLCVTVLWDARTGDAIRQLGHRFGSPAEIGFTADGRVLASACGCWITLYDPLSGVEIGVLRERTLDVSSLAVSPREPVLASGLSGGLIRIWNHAEQRVVRTFRGHRDHIWNLAFSGDGRWLFSVSKDGTIRRWEIETGRSRRLVKAPPEAVRCARPSPDGAVLAVGTTGSAVHLLRCEDGKLMGRFSSPVSGVHRVDFAPGGGVLAGGCFDGKVRLWETGGTGPARTLHAHVGEDPRALHFGSEVAFSPGGRSLATGALDGTIELWDPASGAKRLTLRDGDASGVTFSLSLDGKRVATLDSHGNIRVWGQPECRVLCTIKSGGKLVGSPAFSPEGGLVAAMEESGRLRLWDSHSGKTRRRLPGPLAASMRGTELILGPRAAPKGHLLFSPRGDSAAGAGERNRLHVWSVSNARTLSLKRDDFDPPMLSFSADGRWVATCSGDQSVWLIDAMSGKRRRVLKGHTDEVISVAFSPSSPSLLASGSRDDTVILWDAGTGTLIRQLRGHRDCVRCVAFSEDGRFIASGSDDGTSRVWESATGKPCRVLRVPRTTWIDGVWRVTFSPDGERLAGESWGRVLVWAWARGELLHQLDELSGVVFTRDGKRVIGDAR
ncbi:MAG: pentapeptide repeat-containing protein, partial [Phycisphaerales bacterium]